MLTLPGLGVLEAWLCSVYFRNTSAGPVYMSGEAAIPPGGMLDVLAGQSYRTRLFSSATTVASATVAQRLNTQPCTVDALAMVSG